MTTDGILTQIPALALFAFVMSITPGPNNMLLLASGANFGLKRTLPLILGITFGGSFMIAMLGLGVGQAFERWPLLYTILRVCSVAYLLWLAWKIANAGPVTASGGTDDGRRPISFLQSCAFQWINPKAWAAYLTAVSAYTVPDRYAASLAVVIATFVLVNLPSVSVWALFGQALRGVLADPVRARWFNVAMALALLASLWPVVAEWAR